MFPSRRITTMGGNKFRDEFSLAFDGTDDYIKTGTPFNHTNLTIVSWIKVTDDGDSKTIFSNRKNGTTKGAMLYIDANEEIVFKVENVNTTGVAITAGRWYHIVATYNGIHQKVYVDGVLMETETRTETSLDTDTNAMIGGDSLPSSGSQYYFNGNISEVAIYSTTFSADSVKRVYNNREPYDHANGIVQWALEAWYRMGDGTLDKSFIGSTTGTSDETSLIGDEVNPTFGSELVSNGDFDDETNYADANMEGDDTADLSTEQVLVGTNSLKIDVDSSGEGTRLGGFSVVAGKIYRISAWFYVTAGTAKINPHDDYWEPNTIEPKTTTTNQWEQIVVYNFAQTTTSNPYVYFMAGSNDSVFYLDNVSVRQVNGNAGVALNSGGTFEGDTP